MGEVQKVVCADAASAVKAMRRFRKGRQFMMSADIWLPTSEGRGFNYPINVPVSRAVAADIIRRSLSDTLVARGATLVLDVYDNMIFVGGYAAKEEEI